MALPNGGKMLLRNSVAHATRSSAGAGTVLVVGEAVTVIVGEFFARLNRASRIEPEPIAYNRHLTIGVAAMIEEAGQIPRDTAVDMRVFVECKDVGIVPIQFGLCLGVGEFGANVFDDALVALEVNPCEGPGCMD